MNNLVAFKTLLRKELLRVFRIWKQTLLPPVITSILYILIFGVSLGSYIKDFQGVTYLQFILPGLAMMAVLTNAYTNTSSSFFGMKFQSSIQEILVSPISNLAVVGAFVLAGMIRGMIVGILVLIVGRLFTDIPLMHMGLILFFFAVVALIFASLGLLNGLTARSFDDVSIFPTFVITPLTYLGGVFYSIALLPPFWKALSQFNPLLYFINGIRYGFLGLTDVNIYFAIGLSSILAAGSFGLAWYLYAKGYKLKD